MWLAGDAEQEAIDWFLGDGALRSRPGMRVNVLKADHHGSCNGVTTRISTRCDRSFATASVGRGQQLRAHAHAGEGVVSRASRAVVSHRPERNDRVSQPRHGRAASYTVTVQRGTTEHDRVRPTSTRRKPSAIQSRRSPTTSFNFAHAPIPRIAGSSTRSRNRMASVEVDGKSMITVPQSLLPSGRERRTRAERQARRLGRRNALRAHDRSRRSGDQGGARRHRRRR